MRKRFDNIDLLRAFGILGVIVVHILTYNLSSPIYKFLWNYLQFVVVGFVFCSGFVLASIYSEAFTNISSAAKWYKKRLIRLIIPFWIYLVVHYSLWIVFPNLFQGLGLVKTPMYFFQSAIFTGGTNLNWLPLLFLQLTFLFPIFTNLIKNKKLIVIYVLIAGLVTTYFTLVTFLYSYYRVAMFVPWSLVLILAMITAVKDKTENALQTNLRYLVFAGFSFAVYISLIGFNMLRNSSLNFYDHKYPPDFYYLFFGVALTFLFLILGKLKVWQNTYVKKFYFFVSNNSYQIFFIHYILLDMVLTLSKRNELLKDSLIEFLLILSLSLLITELFNRANKKVSAIIKK